MDTAFTRTVEADESGMRLDHFLRAHLPDFSREKLKRAVQQGLCRIQGITVTDANTRLLAGQNVSLTPPSQESGIIPEKGDIDILWQDEHLLVVNKPAGITVHPCPSCPQGTLVHRLAAHYPQLLQQEGARPGIVHRLDKDTSGLMLVALTEPCRLRLTELFAAREVHKTYLALVYGVPPQQGTVTEPIGRHPHSKVKMAVVPESKGGRAAHSQWEVLWASPDRRFSLLKVRIFTGRTHQIRVHMTHAGYPLVGDAVYGSPPPPALPHVGKNVPPPGKSKAARLAAPKHSPAVTAPRQMLHAHTLELTHPLTGQALHFTSPPPSDLLDCAVNLTQVPWRVVITGLPGCGKSSLLAACAAAGMPTWNADTVVHKLYAVGGVAWDFLRQRFGTSFVADAHSPVDRAALRRGMESDPHLRQEVEAVVHSLVRENLAAFWQKNSTTHQLAVAEIPLFLETGWQQHSPCTLLAGVYCPQNVRWQRLMQHRQWTKEQCARMDGWQWPEAKKYAACDIVINNSGDAASLQDAVPQLITAVSQKNAQQQANILREIITCLG